MKTISIVCLCLLFLGCKSNKNINAEQDKVNSEQKFDSVITNNIHKIQEVKSKQVDSTKLQNKFSKIGTWKIHGNEPFWNIYIENDKIVFTKLNENIDTVFFRVNDFYFIDDGISLELKDMQSVKAILNIYQKAEPVSDGMSDKLYDYYASLKYNDIELKGVAEKK